MLCLLASIGFGVWFKSLGFDSWILFNSCGAFALGGLDRGDPQGPASRVERNRYASSRCSSLASGSVGFAYLYWYYTKSCRPGWSPGAMAWRDSFQNFAYLHDPFRDRRLRGHQRRRGGSWPRSGCKELTYLGEISYGMYLYHLPVYWLVGGYLRFTLGESWSMWSRQDHVDVYRGNALLSLYRVSRSSRSRRWFPVRGETIGPSPGLSWSRSGPSRYPELEKAKTCRVVSSAARPTFLICRSEGGPRRVRHHPTS